MFNTIVCKGRKVLGSVKNRLAPTTAELKDRQQVAFEILHPQVETVKASPAVQIAVGTIITAAIVSGNWGTAAAITGCWLGSRPLTRVAASGVACVGMADTKLLAAIQRLQTVQAAPVRIATLGL